MLGTTDRYLIISSTVEVATNEAATRVQGRKI
jgi:hypothetical protein